MEYEREKLTDNLIGFQMVDNAIDYILDKYAVKLYEHLGQVPSDQRIAEVQSIEQVKTESPFTESPVISQSQQLEKLEFIEEQKDGYVPPQRSSFFQKRAISEVSKKESMSEFVRKIQKERSIEYELMVMGNTNSGKSTFLNDVTKIRGLFNTSETRETSCVWRVRIVKEQVAPFIVRIKEIYENKDNEELFSEILEEKLFDDFEAMKLYTKEVPKSPLLREPQTPFSEEEQKQTERNSTLWEAGNSMVQEQKIVNSKEIEITIRENIPGFEYKILQQMVQLLDIPGLEDGSNAGNCSILQAHYLQQYILNKKERIIPVIIFNLMQGDFKNLQQFSSIIPALKSTIIPITVVFTKLSFLEQGIKSKLLEEPVKGHVQKVLTPEEIEEQIIIRIRSVIQGFVDQLVGIFKREIKFFIYNKGQRKNNCYKFDYSGMVPQIVFEKFEGDQLPQGMHRTFNIEVVISHFQGSASGSLLTNIIPQKFQYRMVSLINSECRKYWRETLAASQNDTRLDDQKKEFDSAIDQFGEDCVKKASKFIQSPETRLRMMEPLENIINNFLNGEARTEIFIRQSTFNFKLQKQVFDNVDQFLKNLTTDLSKQVIQEVQKELFKKMSEIINGNADDQEKMDLLEKLDFESLKLKKENEELRIKKLFINPANYLWTRDIAAVHFIDHFQKIFMNQPEYIQSIVDDYTVIIKGKEGQENRKSYVGMYKERVKKVIDNAKNKNINEEVLKDLELIYKRKYRLAQQELRELGAFISNVVPVVFE